MRGARALRWVRWLAPGIGVKRWLALAVGGASLCGAGLTLMATRPESWIRLAGLTGVGLGLAASCVGLIQAIRSVLEVMDPVTHGDLVTTVLARRHLQKGLKIVAIGGGTGLSTLLRGLKAYTMNVTAIVSVADDGGSSGRLRKEFGILPPGDIRNCLVALADAEPLLQQMFQYRFTEGSSLRGHNVGNLLLTALTRLEGDFEHAIQEASRVLAIRGRVVPSTSTKVQLVAKHDDGSLTVGESKISQAQQPIRRLWLEPRNSLPTTDALSAIRAADLILVGPGSLFTSLIPNLLVPGIVQAMLHSAALRVYLCNVMTQFRETHGFTASDHVRALAAHTHPDVVDLCVVNKGGVPDALLATYRGERAFPVEPDVERIRALGYQVVIDDLISSENMVRHDPEKLARAVMRLEWGSRRPPAGRRRLNGHRPNGNGRGVVVGSSREGA
ncbi:MAG: YvcK family protein [Candidatus Omnitrophota bacterium]|nr:YvcK family protein [Candidatus Omnitrophota bacterium]